MLHPATANDYMMQEAVLGGIWNEIKTGFNDKVLHGDADSKGKYAGTAIWTAITLFNPEGKIGDLEKVDKVINVADKSDEGFDIIKKADKVIDPSKLSDVWKLGATERGEVIEEILASTEYKDWYNVGASRGGYFPVIDFQKGNSVISLKTIDPTLSSMSGSGATNKVIDYLNDLDKEIKVDGNLANKILDVRIPEGTKGNFNLRKIKEVADKYGIKVIIKEF